MKEHASESNVCRQSVCEKDYQSHFKNNYYMAIEFLNDERTIQERFAERFETFYAYYLSMMEQYKEYVNNELDHKLFNRTKSLNWDLKCLSHDLSKQAQDIKNLQ